MPNVCKAVSRIFLNRNFDYTVFISELDGDGIAARDGELCNTGGGGDLATQIFFKFPAKFKDDPKPAVVRSTETEVVSLSEVNSLRSAEVIVDEDAGDGADAVTNRGRTLDELVWSVKIEILAIFVCRFSALESWRSSLKKIKSIFIIYKVSIVKL